uniref:DUF3822 family protein n=1 Tax=Panagrellus redivivus TaxID=6233 RepID=A0A7E5A1X7_PANRE
MPYPILTLPYPFSKRLYQLLSPLELQRLQTAAGYDIHDLQPLVTTHTVDSFYAYSWKHVPAPPFTIVIKVPGKEQIALPNVDHVVNCRYETNLWYMSSSTFKNLKTRMVGTPQANFIYCDITNDFLQQASKVVETSVVNIILSKVKEDVNFLSVTQMFPKVKSILFNYYADPEKRIENNYLFGRDYLYFAFCRFEEFYCFKPEELFDFINVSLIVSRK